MRRSSERILTTHAGSLPRPENLTDLFIRRARGESIDADTIAAAGLAAVGAIVPRQAEAGVDIGNNGEQHMIRSSFISRTGSPALGEAGGARHARMSNAIPSS